MSAEITPATPKQPASRKHRKLLTILWSSAIILYIGGHYWFSSVRMQQNLGSVNDDWIRTIVRDNSPIVASVTQTQMGTNPLGAYLNLDATFTPPSGKAIRAEFRLRDWFAFKFESLKLSCEGRTVDWPVKELRRGQKLDLRASFPEAFR